MNYYTYRHKRNRLPKRVLSESEKKEIKDWKSTQRKVRKKKTKKVKKPRTYNNRIPRKYNVYIKSIHWENRKNAYYRKHKKQCYRCNSCEHVQLHHIVYKWQTFGSEADDTLVPMCHTCHDLFHSLYGVSGNMQKEMLDFEKDYQYSDNHCG